MIDPKADLKEGQRISLPHELVSEIVALLAELPARQSMGLILAIQTEAEIVEVHESGKTEEDGYI